MILPDQYVMMVFVIIAFSILSTLISFVFSWIRGAIISLIVGVIGLILIATRQPSSELFGMLGVMGIFTLGCCAMTKIMIKIGFCPQSLDTTLFVKNKNIKEIP